MSRTICARSSPRFRAAVEPLQLSYEIIITDDCSTDKSWAILKELAAGDPRVRAQRFAFNCGESAASFAGMKAARGQYIVTLDADLQNDPKDLPKFLEALKNYDCVCGTRVEGARRGRQLHPRRLLAHRQLGAQQIVRRDKSPTPAAPTAPSSASAWRI